MEQLKIESFLDYRFLSNLDFNKKGIAAFTVAKSNLNKNSYDNNIYIIDENEKVKKLTSLSKEKNLLWLDDNKILFISDRDEKIKALKEEGEKWTSFYSIDIRGGEAEKLFDLELDVTSIKKIDEDNFILTAIFDNNDLNLNGKVGEEREIIKNQLKENKDYEILDEIPFWGNGKGFTNKKRNRLYIYNFKTKNLKAISDELTEVESYNIKDNKILFIAERFSDKLQQTNALYEYDIKNDKLETIIEDGLYNFSYANYFDNKIIVLCSDMKSYGINENQDIYLIENKKIKEFKKIDACIGSSVGSDARLGSGKAIKVVDDKLYFITTINDYSCLKALDKNGNIEILSDTDGSVDMFDVLSDKIYFIGFKNNKLQEIYKLENSKNIQLSNFNEEILEKYTIQKPEKIEFITNGDTTEGYVIKPVNYQDGKIYPAILDIHGGPKTVYGNIFYHEMQVWANMGYFVFFCNPHGSEGKGNEFADIRGKYGTIDYEDIMNFTDLVLERYPIDKNKVGVTGGSYGGFMTNWIIGHTDRFVCAASQRSIANWISKFGTTDIGYYFNADQNQSTPWIEHDKLWWHSPLKYADKVKTPTLFIHSEQDYRCWIAEGIQMFTSLKYHGVDSRLCMFREENHELSRSGKPKHRIKRLKEMTDWFEKYCK